MMTPKKKTSFLEALQSYYTVNGRHDLPWRLAEPGGSFDPYKILVSEIMLQQTQVPRVIAKYRQFLSAFPTLESLAAAELGQVLRVWSGLGYNRRAKYLHDASKVIASLKSFPNSITELVKLPGIGKNTAGAVLVYAFNKPAIFIETNVRTVYIHHFFAGKTGISDTEILNVLTQTLPKGKEQPELDSLKPGAMRKTAGLSHREFYWALMDYGTHLKGEVGNISKLSKHYRKQSAFLGSRRQTRGQVLQLLSEKQHTLTELKAVVDDERLQDVLYELIMEGLIRQTGNAYRL